MTPTTTSKIHSMNEFINLIYAAEQFGIAVTLLVVSFSVVYFFGKTLENKIRRIRRLKNEITCLVTIVREKEAKINLLQTELSERIVENNELRKKYEDLLDDTHHKTRSTCNH